jgi:hypothetical protein
LIITAGLQASRSLAEALGTWHRGYAGGEKAAEIGDMLAIGPGFPEFAAFFECPDMTPRAGGTRLRH